MKNLIVFDMDGTIAESKAAIDSEMAAHLKALLALRKVAVISGGEWVQFEKQLIANLPSDAQLERLFILPTSGTQFYKFDKGWTKVYEEDFSADERTKILDALHRAITASGLKPEHLYGEQIEDRGSQITFSALGQQAPIEEKAKWDPGLYKRTKIVEILQPLIPEFSVRLGGTTSIDITRPGIDKAYGIQKLRDIIEVPLAEMLYIGDALFPGGNDYPAIQLGVTSIRVRDPEETKRVIEAIVACLG